MFGFYSDPALTTPITTLNVVTLLDGDPVTISFWIGSTDDTKSLQPSADASIILSVSDADTGDGLPASAITLAMSEVDLDTAVAGDPVDIGAEVLGGVAGAVNVWMRVDPGANPTGEYIDLGFVTNDVIEVSF